MAFMISTAKVDITPQPGANPYMAGYGIQGAQRVVLSDTPYAQPLYARCVVLWDNGNPNAIVSLDLLGITRRVHQAVRPRLVRLANWVSSDIVLVASHTHNGPVFGDMLDPYIGYDLVNLDLVGSYTAWVQDRIVSVVTNALAAARTAVTLDYRTATASFAFNRAGLPTVETAVPVLTARRSNGAPHAVLFSYGCHPVSAGWQEEWDGDWPAQACDVIERDTGAFALFLPGPAGDQDPSGVRSWDLRDNHGTSIGRAVATAAKIAGRTLSGPIASQIREVNLPLDITATAANLAAVRSAFAARMQNPAGQPAWYQRHAQSMITRIDSGTYATSVPNPSQVWHIGGNPDLKMAFVGGELVSGYAAYFRDRNGGASNLFIGGYANETNSYVPANNFLPPLAPSWGSYEGGWDSDYPGIAGGSMTVYPQIAHFRAGSAGVEAAVISALAQQLA
jgi:neutral ceramidase